MGNWCCCTLPVQKSKLFDPAEGWLKDDTLEIHVAINVLLTAGKPSSTCINPLLAEDLEVPAPSTAADMSQMLQTGMPS
jgi:hypothetical protein